MWKFIANRSKTIRTKQKRQSYRPYLEQLEDRRLFATNITQYHVDAQSTGANLTETQLTSSNVNAADFGQMYNTPLDGQVYAEPLVMTNVTITAGANTVGTPGIYNSVVYVATQHDSLYAINAANGAILWHRTFLDTSNSNDHLAGASSVSTCPTGVNEANGPGISSTDVSPEIGITGTPVIDASNNILYLIPKTEETVSGTVYFVQRLHAINLSNGTDATTSFVIGTTTAGNTNNTPVYVNGTGDGSVGGVVQFNALREANRPALSLVNGQVYAAWASHGDEGPYHGWVVRWNVANLAANGMVLSGVLCTDPNGGLGGIWGGGGGLTFDPDESFNGQPAFYFETGNGATRGANPPLDANGFPADHSYYESLVKVEADPTTTATNQNSNGWGLKVADYFTPYNVNALDGADEDFGSGSPLVLPDSAGIPGHPHLIVACGKEGTIYLVDRDNMGKFTPNADNVLNSVYNPSTGISTPPVLINGSLSTPAYYHGEIYWVSGYNSNAWSYIVAPNPLPNPPTVPVAVIQPTSETANGSFGYVPGSVVISANGNEDPADAVVWIMDRANNELHAYSALSLSTELWNSGAGSIATVKFAVPTVANGQVFVGTQNSLQVFGITGAATPVHAPNAVSNLSAQALSGSSVQLTWTDSTVSPNFATNYAIQKSATLNGTYTTVANTGQQATTYTVTGLSQNTTYYFRIVSSNSAGSSSPSTPSASATTTNQTGPTPTAPVGLGATPASGSEAYLTWTNTAANETGFTLTRATDSLFTQNVVVQTLASAPYYYTDHAPGITPGTTYYYKIQATNASGSSSSSNTASVNIPNVPPAPTNAAAVQAGNTIEVSWTDHAGPFALGYQISRSVDGGPFVIYANRPETSDAPPSTQTFTDTNVPLGHVYTYSIVAENVAGFSDPAYATASILGSAVLSLDSAGHLTFTVAPGAPDQLNVQFSGGVYTLSDIAVNISVTGTGSGFVTPVGTSSVTIPTANVSAMTLDTSDSTDVISIVSDAVPITITADSGGGNPIIKLGDPTQNETISGDITNASNAPITISGSGTTTINGNLICQGGGGVTLAGTGVINIAGNINLGASASLNVGGSGQDTITGVISGTATSANGLAQGLIGAYYNINNLTTNDGAALIQPAAASNPSWLGNQIPAATSVLVGPVDFPDIQQDGNAMGFTDTLGNTYYNLNANPGAGANNNVEARWYGNITIPGTGTTPVPVNFQTGSDDGSMLYIDGNAVVNNNFYQGVTYRSGLVNLTPGLHAIDIEFFQGLGGAAMVAQWDPTGGTNFVDIPNSAFSSVQPVNGLNKTGNGTLTLSNTNTYLGLTTINAGTVVVTANGAMGPAGAAGVVVNSGGDLAFSGGVNYTDAEPVSVAGVGPGRPIPSAYVGFTGATGGANSEQDILNWTYSSGATNIDYSSGFAANNLSLNGGAALNGSALELTDGNNNEARTAWTPTPVAAGSFTSTFQWTYGNTVAPVADGFTFAVQNAGATALGAAGGGLAYNGIAGNSFAAEFNLYNGVSQFGVGVNGAVNHPIDLTASGIDFHANPNDIYQATVTDDGQGNVTVSIWDTTTNTTPTPNYTGTFSIISSYVTGGGAIQNLSGTNTFAGPITLAASSSLGANAGSLTLNGPINAAAGTLTLVGASGAALNIAGNVSLGAVGNLVDSSSGNDTISGVISGTATSGTAAIPGLIGTYFNLNSSQAQISPANAGNTAWLGNQTPAATAQLVGPVDFRDIQNNGFADSAGNPAYFSVPGNQNVEARWYGNITIPGAGTTPVPISFGTASDDGSMIYIDGNAVVSNDNYQGAPAYPGLQVTNTVNLTPGLHAIDIEFMQGGGGAAMWAQWDPAGGNNFVDIPISAFSTVLPVNGVTKSGSGTLTLANTNSYIGTTAINAGQLVVTANGAMGPATAAGVVVKPGGALGLAGGVNYTTGEPTTIAGAGPAGNGAIENISGTNSYGAPISVTGTATIGADAGSMTLAGNINLGVGNLVATGAGQTIISGVISGSSATGTILGLVGTYFNLGASTAQISPASPSNPAWLGNQTPAVTAQLVGPIDFPDIQAEADTGVGFTDTQGHTYYNLNTAFGQQNNNNVEARWYGNIMIPGTGTTPVPINFRTGSDDGSMLYIDGAAVVNNDFFQGVTYRSGLANLTPGLHTIDVEFMQGGGGAAMFAQWDPTGGTTFVDIPNSAFVQPVNTLTKIGAGSLTLSNSNNSYAGATTVNAGTLIVTANHAMGPATAAGVVVNSGGALAFSGGVNYTTAEPTTLSGSGPAGNGAVENISGNNTFAGPLTLASADATIGSDAGNLSLTAPTLTLSPAANLTTVGASNVAISGAVQGFVPTSYVGFTGGTGGLNAAQNLLNWTYASGTTNINYGSGFATNNLTLNGGATVVGSTLQLTDANNGEARSAWTPTPVPAGNFTTTFQWTYGANPQADGFTFAVQNSGPTALGAGGGMLGYNGIGGNSFAAEFNLYPGVSQFGVGLNGAITYTIDLTASGIDFHANASDTFQATITDNGTGSLTVSIWDRTLNSTATPNFSQAFTIPASPVANNVTINGAGTVILGGANTYTGATTVNAGKLLVDGQVPNPAVTVNTGGTLGGTGTVAATTISGGKVSPGDPTSSTGTLAANSADFSSGGNLTANISGVSTADRLNVTNAVTLGGTSTLTLDLNGLALPTSGALTIVSAGSVTGTFSAVNLINNPNGFTANVAYTATTVVVTILKAPTTISLTDNGPNPSAAGQAVSFTVTVAGGAPINEETVTIEDADAANAPVGTGILTGSTVTFNISTLAVGAHHLFAVYGGDTTHLDSNSSQTPVVQNVITGGAAPAVVSVVVNGGAPQYTDANGVQVSLAGQNSIVEQLLVTFNEAVTLDANAFTISTNLANFVSLGGVETPNTDPVGLNAPIPVAGSGGTQFILTFLAGSGVNSIPGPGSGTYIKDGVYNLNTIGSHVHANSQTATDNHAGFWALFGSVAADNNLSNNIGDGTSDILVDTPDAAQFKIAFGTENDSSLLPGQPYDAAMDSNLSGVIGTEDAAKFKHNFGTEWMF